MQAARTTTKRKLLKIGLAGIGGYLVLVIAFASFVVYQGQSHAERGVGKDEDWITLTTTNGAGKQIDSVLAGVEVDGALYVATNHWPRSWYDRAIENPLVFVTINGAQAEYRATPLGNAEHDHLTQEYAMPLVFRFLTGFPPRRFLRIEG